MVAEVRFAVLAPVDLVAVQVDVVCQPHDVRPSIRLSLVPAYCAGELALICVTARSLYLSLFYLFISLSILPVPVFTACQLGDLVLYLLR